MRCFCICNGRKAPAITVDAVVEKEGKILLIKRRNKPFKDCWALPGGFVECGESAERAIEREVEEEAGLKIRVKKLLGVYSEPERDPRGHVISICYLASARGRLRPASDAVDAKFFTLEEIKKLKLAFDHGKIIRDYAGSKKPHR